MDLLGDIGNADQLTSVRSENAVLNKKVKELSLKVKELTIENQSLLAEVEIYRTEGSSTINNNINNNGSPLLLSSSGGNNTNNDDDTIAGTEFIKSGNGTYPTEAVASLEQLHQNSNPLCCALHPIDDTVLATGGADFYLSLCQWGGALVPNDENAAYKVTQKAIRLRCPGPVICVAFSHQSHQNQGSTLPPIVAAGCMDGSVVMAGFQAGVSGLTAKLLKLSEEIKFTKYIKNLCWSPTAPLLAVASADGMVIIYKVVLSSSSFNLDEVVLEVTVDEKLHLSGTVETLCFTGEGRSLVCYVRDTPYLSHFNIEKDYEHTKTNLNKTSGDGVCGGFGDHVSFAVMDMAMSPNNKYIALATDKSRNIVIDSVSGKQIRNLYGHTNDGFSNPKIGWSKNGQYVFGNTQEDGSVCVWDVASAKIVKRLEGHKNPIRSMYSSRITDTLVTTSFDKNVKIWLN